MPLKTTNWPSLLTLLALSHTVSASAAETVLANTLSVPRSWRFGEPIPVECVNRTIDWGEHVTDAKGNFQYIPFPTCLETGRPLELVFGSEADINCTLEAISDPLFHLFEFYIHDDAPLSCRMPALAGGSRNSIGGGAASNSGSDSTGVGSSSGGASTDNEYTRMQVALTGTLQLSHLHINPQLNVVVHTTAGPDDSDDDEQKKKKGASQKSSDGQEISEGRLLAAAAYSLPPTSHSPRIVIGDSLPLKFSVRWFSERTLPASTSRVRGMVGTGLGGHVHFSTVLYCLLSFGGGVAVSLAYWRGVELPRRMRRYGAEKIGFGMDGGRSGYAFPGKRD